MPLGNSYTPNGDDEQKFEWKAPYTEEEFAALLIEKLSTNYKEKFGVSHVPEKNVFSVSALVSGPGTAVGNRKRTLEDVDPETGEEKKVFNMAMFRGSAIHKYFEEKLPDFHAYGSEMVKCEKCGSWVGGKKLHIQEIIPYDWQDGTTKGIIIKGHPDGVKRNVLIEIKTISSTEKDPVKRAKYKSSVLKKAKFQGGCYAKMLTRELNNHIFCYVVTLDEEPDRHDIKEEDKKNGFIMINDGKFKLQLNEKMLKKGYVTDSHLRVYLLSEDEMWHGYNYVRWSAREAVKIIENDEAGIVSADEVPVIGPLGKQKDSTLVNQQQENSKD